MVFWDKFKHSQPRCRRTLLCLLYMSPKPSLYTWKVTALPSWPSDLYLWQRLGEPSPSSQIICRHSSIVFSEKNGKHQSRKYQDAVSGWERECNELILWKKFIDALLVVHLIHVCHKLSFTHLQANHTSLEMLASLETVSDFLNDRNILVVTLLYLHRVTEFSFAGEAVIYMAINLLVHHKAFPDICNETTMRIHFLNADIAFPQANSPLFLNSILSIKEDTAVQCSGWCEPSKFLSR